jgi:hypothetical protein
LSELPPVPWADNDGSLASKLFGVPFESKPTSGRQVASIDSATRERGADSATTGSTATAAKPVPQQEADAVAPPIVGGGAVSAPPKGPADSFDGRWSALR